MANRYCNFTGNQKIKDTYDLIPKGFDKVQVDMDEVIEDVDDLQQQINSLVVDGDSSPAIDQALAGTGFETLREYLASIMYLQEDEPMDVNSKTLWFDINSTINFSQGGVVIENAETSAAPPETFYWFEPIL